MKQQDNVKGKMIKNALSIGAAGGFFWSALGYLAYFFEFTKIGPSIFISPFVSSTFVGKPLAHLIGIGVATVLSIIFALVYVFTLSKFYQPWIGVGCGIVLFGVFYYILNPLFSLTKKPIHAMGMNTFSTEFCLFTLFGLFIGFSLSTEFSSQEKSAKAK